MQRKFVIEVICDFANPTSFEAISGLVQHFAVQLQANALLISDAGGQKPKTVCYADDYFKGREEIDLLAAKVKMPISTGLTSPDEELSDEMMETLQKMGKR